MQHKTLVITGVKTSGLDEGEFEGFASVFDNLDAHGDIVRRGAFAKAIGSEQVIPLIWQHGYGDPRNFVGQVIEARETDEGLAIRGKIDLDSEHGAAVWRNVKARRVGALSIGYAIRNSTKTAAGRELTDLDLLEISIVQRGANDRALITAAKSAPSALLKARIQLLKASNSMPETKIDNVAKFTKDRDTQLAAAQSIIDTATELQRDLTGDEQAAVEEHLGKAQTASDWLAKKERSDQAAATMAQLDAQARSMPSIDPITGEPFTGTPAAEGHLALTGTHAKSLAQHIVKAMPRQGTKALATGAQTVSTVVLPGIVEQGRPAVSLLDILPSRLVPASYVFLRQSVRTFAAAPVAAGSTKPTSTVSVGSIPNRLRVVAHLSEAVDHYLLSDNDNLQTFVTAELIYGLRRAVETQIISGDGTGENMLGILNTSGIQTVAFSTSALVSVRKALTALDTLGYTASTIVLSALDWQDIELLAATQGATDNRGVPIDPVARRLWGVPVVLNQGLGAKVGLVLGDGAVTLDHDGRVETRWSDAVASDFSANQVRARCEGRFGISVGQPTAVVKVATAA